MPDTNILVFELPEKELSTALAAFKEDADLRFAPDRAWIEGYAAASKAKHTEAPKSPDAEETRRTDVALAILEVMREHEDRCDLSLDDIPTSHQVWLCADAAIAAQALDAARVFWQQHTQADALSMTMAELHSDVELVIRATSKQPAAQALDAWAEPDHEALLVAAQGCVAASQRMDSAMQDGVNVHGAMSVIIGATEGGA